MEISKRAHLPDPHFPTPTDNDGWTAGGNKMEPLWSKLDTFPPKLVDVVESAEEDSSDDEFDSSSERDFSDPDHDRQ